MLPSPTSWELATEQDYDAIGELVEPAQLHGPVRVSDDLSQHAAWLQEYVDLGFDELYLHHVGEEQSGFIDAFGDRVLPQLDVTAKPVPASTTL